MPDAILMIEHCTLQVWKLHRGCTQIAQDPHSCPKRPRQLFMKAKANSQHLSTKRAHCLSPIIATLHMHMHHAHLHQKPSGHWWASSKCSKIQSYRISTKGGIISESGACSSNKLAKQPRPFFDTLQAPRMHRPNNLWSLMGLKYMQQVHSSKISTKAHGIVPKSAQASWWNKQEHKFDGLVFCHFLQAMSSSTCLWQDVPMRRCKTASQIVPSQCQLERYYATPK